MRHFSVMSLYSLLLPTMLLAGLFLLLIRRLPRLERRLRRPLEACSLSAHPRLEGLLDPLITAALCLAGPLYMNRLHRQGNPHFLPIGQDWLEFLGYAIHLVTPGAGAPVGNRYPLYPWLGATLARETGVPAHVGCMQVSIVAAGLLVPCLYLLGRRLMPRSLALVSAFLALHGATLLEMTGPPTEYVFYALLQLLCLVTGVGALRNGGVWRFLALGSSLALVMAAAAKSLLVLVLAWPMALLGLIWHFRRAPLRMLLAAALFLLPQGAIWQMYTPLTPSFHTLEGLVFRAQSDRARTMHLEIKPPTDLGWDPALPVAAYGYWRVGDPSALRNLPRTLQFLSRGAEGNFPLSERVASMLTGLTRELPVGPWGLLLLVPACLALGQPGRQGRWRLQDAPGWLLAGGFGTALVATQFLSLISSTYEPRYGLSVLVMLPTLILGGATVLLRLPVRAAYGDLSLPWWPATLVLCAWLGYGSGPLGGQAVQAQLAALEHNRDDDFYRPLFSLAELSPLPQLVDTTRSFLVPSLFPPEALTALVPDPTTGHDTVKADRPDPQATRTGQSARPPRRFIIQPCQQLSPYGVKRWTSLEPQRLRAFGECIDEDLTPEKDLPLVPILEEPGEAGR